MPGDPPLDSPQMDRRAICFLVLGAGEKTIKPFDPVKIFPGSAEKIRGKEVKKKGGKFSPLRSKNSSGNAEPDVAVPHRRKDPVPVGRAQAPGIVVPGAAADNTIA